MTSLLALLDDIATTLDDVAVMTKVATKKTTGILGDDLALNAEQLVGIDSSRELSIIKSVVKGSLLNKLILVPLALALNFYLPFVLKILLLVGGIYLAFEGIEKVVDKLFHKKAEKEVKIVSEKDKIKGAVRTDFILSAEIIVIALSTMLDKPFWLQATVLSMVALTVTFFIYGVVALIVRLDDMGLSLVQKYKGWRNRLGQVLIKLSPKIVKFLGIIGTIAMFLVGGGIVAHFFHFSLIPQEDLNNLVTGICSGVVVFIFLEFIHLLVKKLKKDMNV